VLDGADAVCHQAGKVGLGRDFRDAPAYAAENDLGWAVGLGVMHDRGFAGRIVLASSMVIYGEGRYRCATDGIVQPGPRVVADLESGCFEPHCGRCGGVLVAEAVPEEAPADPRNVYAATKLHQEHLLASFAREHPVQACWLRYHNVYGPRMPRDTPYAGVASIFRSALERGDPPSVTEDGLQRRDFVHVADVARVNVLALLGDEPMVGACNVASGTPHTVGEMAQALAAAVGAVPGDHRWPVVTGGYRLGDVRHVFASTARMEAVPDARARMAEFASASMRAPARVLP
jgi:dTDP-L-rhamnose 4-epimerase